jgi:hypothetical protein
VSEGFLPDLDDKDLGGLVRELAWLAWLAWLGRRSCRLLFSELSDEVDPEGVWYGFPTPNSSARLIVGTTGVFGLPTPVRGGGGPEVPGPPLGLRVFSLVIGARPSRSPGASNGDRNRSGRMLSADGGAEGERAGGAKRSLGRGNVSDRFGDKGCSSAPPSGLGDGPRPPSPFCLGPFGPVPLPSLLLGLPAEVPGRSGPAAEGRRPVPKGPAGIEFNLSIKLGACFFGALAGRAESSSPLLPSSPPYPPGLGDCGGGGELLAILGPKYSSALPRPGRRALGVWGDTALWDPLERLTGVSWV